MRRILRVGAALVLVTGAVSLLIQLSLSNPAVGQGTRVVTAPVAVLAPQAPNDQARSIRRLGFRS
jgi:hypothetical protein